MLFEFAVLTPDGTGKDGANALLEGGAVVGAHPANKLENGIVDVGLVANEGLDGFQGVECAGRGEGNDIASNMTSPEGNGDATADLDLTLQLWGDGVVKLPIKRYIDYDFGDHGSGSGCLQKKGSAEALPFMEMS